MRVTAYSLWRRFGNGCTDVYDLLGEMRSVKGILTAEAVRQAGNGKRRLVLEVTDQPHLGNEKNFDVPVDKSPGSVVSWF